MSVSGRPSRQHQLTRPTRGSRATQLRNQGGRHHFEVDKTAREQRNAFRTCFKITFNYFSPPNCVYVTPLVCELGRPVFESPVKLTSRAHSWKPARYLSTTEELSVFCRCKWRTVSSRMSAFSSFECFVFCC